MEVLSCIKSKIKQISHSSYHCEYHILFVPKYKRKVIYKLLKNTIKREKTEFTKINVKSKRFIGKTKLKT